MLFRSAPPAASLHRDHARPPPLPKSAAPITCGIPLCTPDLAALPNGAAASVPISSIASARLVRRSSSFDRGGRVLLNESAGHARRLK
jgi:hypothetical protein